MPLSDQPTTTPAAPRRRWRHWLRYALGAVLLGAMTSAVAIYFCPRPELYPSDLVFSKTLYDRNGKLLQIALTPDDKYRVFTPMAGISRELGLATLIQEDRHFYSHPGFNPLSLLRALSGVALHEARGGGSTVTMQYARLRYHLHTRTLRGKLVQIFRAIQLERHYSKQAILEAYLNLAPYGGNVEGAAAASWFWCGHAPDQLTRREAVALAVLPQSPTRRKPKPTGENPSLAAAQQRLLHHLEELATWRTDPLDGQFILRPSSRTHQEVPQLARRLLKPAAPGATLHTTLDLEKQRVLERTITDYIQTHHQRGITNACALLLHAPTREVLAYVGSAQFSNARIQGQIDGIRMRRSPGSSLKPFIYALAIQQGLIQPHTLLSDSRKSFAEYAPENYDRQFAGPITAEDALYYSRNIPAVALAHRLSGSGFFGFLKSAGVALPFGRNHYGLTLPLGGAEVSPEELGMLYAMLGDDGVPRPLRYLSDGAPSDPQSAPPLLSPAACFLTRQMLKPREEEPQFDDPLVSWKTGTSHGFRDAWTAGVRGQYVLVVWVGNFNGRPNHSFIGREAAAPLLFDAFHRLHLPGEEAPLPSTVKQVELCAVSGQLPCPHCHHRQLGWFIPGISPIAPCSIHREICIDPATGLRLASDDGRPGLKHEVWEFWPPDLLELFRQAGLPRREPPALEASAKTFLTANRREAPRILSPKPALVYTLRSSDPDRQSIPLSADAAPGVRHLYWFAGGQFLGHATPTETYLWKATPGKWKVQLLDDQGRTASCEIKVEMVQ